MSRARSNPQQRHHGLLRLWLAWCVPLLTGVQHSAPAQHFNPWTYGASAGLTNLNVTSLVEDHTGAIWVGTQSGVFLVDGQRLVKQQAFTEAGLQYIQALREDPRGRLWAVDTRHLVVQDATGVHRVDELHEDSPHAGRLDLVAVPGDLAAIYLLRDGQLFRVASTDEGRTWTIHPALSPTLEAQHPELRRLTSLVSGGGMSLWAGCGEMICRLDLASGSLETFATGKGVPADRWQSLLVRHDGALWARGDKSLVLMPHPAGRFHAATALPHGTSLEASFPTMAEDAEGEVVLNLGTGVARSRGASWQILDQRNGLPDNELDAILFDRFGELWMGPEGHGLARWNGYGAWEGWTKAEGLRGNLVWGIAQGPGDEVRVVTQGGLDRVRAYAASALPERGELPRHDLRVVAVDGREHIWTGDNQGEVFEVDPHTGHTRLAAKGLGRIMQLLLDKRERVWVCSGAGLVYFTPEDRWRLPHPVEGRASPQGYAWSVAEDKDGTLWASNGQGLFRLTGEVWTHIELPFPGGTRYNFLLAPAGDGTLWVQSTSPFPVLRLSIAGDRATVVERVATAGFGSDNIAFMNVDRRGWLWVGSDDGVHVFNGKHWVLCDQEDGLLWNDTDSFGFLADRDGTVWIGTSGGLSHLLRPEVLFSLPPPQLRLSSARIDTLDVGAGDPTIDLRHPKLTVQLLDTNYSRGHAIAYRYRLVGQDSEWQTAETPSLRFPALAPGPYRLEIAVDDTRLHQSSAPLSLTFRVLEPWWWRSWFLALLPIAFLLLGLLIWSMSVNFFVQRQQALARLVASRTQELEREKAELLSARAALVEMTRRDTLTGLLNRAAIFERMAALCESAIETGRPLAIAMADLDSFKRINDSHGHVMGDTVLRACAERLNRAIRPEDAVGRYGGEELLILMPGLYPESAVARMEQLRRAIAATPIQQDELSLMVTCSFGVAWTNGEPCSLESLVGLADAALYNAKKNGRNRVEFATVHEVEMQSLQTQVR